MFLLQHFTQTECMRLWSLWDCSWDEIAEILEQPSRKQHRSVDKLRFLLWKGSEMAKGRKNEQPRLPAVNIPTRWVTVGLSDSDIGAIETLPDGDIDALVGKLCLAVEGGLDISVKRNDDLSFVAFGFYTSELGGTLCRVGFAANSPTASLCVFGLLYKYFYLLDEGKNTSEYATPQRRSIR